MCPDQTDREEQVVFEEIHGEMQEFRDKDKIDYQEILSNLTERLDLFEQDRCI